MRQTCVQGTGCDTLANAVFDGFVVESQPLIGAMIVRVDLGIGRGVIRDEPLQCLAICVVNVERRAKLTPVEG